MIISYCTHGELKHVIMRIQHGFTVYALIISYCTHGELKPSGSRTLSPALREDHILLHSWRIETNISPHHLFLVLQ